MSAAKRRPLWVTFLLVLLPLWLVASGGGALWYYFQREKKQALVEQERFAQAVSVPLLADDLRKIVEVIGERNASSETAASNLSRTASMIEGLLGPSNTGYTVQKINGPGKWPLLQVTLAGKNPAAPAVWVLTSYDSRVGSRGAEANASGLAATHSIRDARIARLECANGDKNNFSHQPSASPPSASPPSANRRTADGRQPTAVCGTQSSWGGSVAEMVSGPCNVYCAASFATSLRGSAKCGEPCTT